MRPVTLDKIGSVTLNCGFGRDVKVSEEIDCREGAVVAVRIKNNKSIYNHLELTTGRLSPLKEGDVIAGALGRRRALLGYSGDIPTQLRAGDEINILNTGGTMGICSSFSSAVGPPFQCEVLGQVLSFPYLGQRVATPANIQDRALPLDGVLKVGDTPIVAVVGTCMNSGKTLACANLIQQFTRRKLRVGAAKATGVSLRRDVHEMEDAGAAKGLIFTDFGIVTTSRANSAALARGLVTTLAAERFDVIVLELGDGLLGEYGVDAILEDVALRDTFSALLLAAGDPVAAWGGHRLLLDRYGLTPTVITGPATDNSAGCDIVHRDIGCPAINARRHPEALAKVVLEALKLTGEARA